MSWKTTLTFAALTIGLTGIAQAADRITPPAVPETLVVDASFKPVDWRIKLTPAFNVNYLATDELAVVSPDVRSRCRDWQFAGARAELMAARVGVVVVVSTSLARIRAQYGPPGTGLLLAAPGPVLYNLFGREPGPKRLNRPGLPSRGDRGRGAVEDAAAVLVGADSIPVWTRWASRARRRGCSAAATASRRLIVPVRIHSCSSASDPAAPCQVLQKLSKVIAVLGGRVRMECSTVHNRCSPTCEPSSSR